MSVALQSVTERMPADRQKLAPEGFISVVSRWASMRLPPGVSSASCVVWRVTKMPDDVDELCAI